MSSAKSSAEPINAGFCAGRANQARSTSVKKVKTPMAKPPIDTAIRTSPSTSRAMVE